MTAPRTAPAPEVSPRTSSTPPVAVTPGSRLRRSGTAWVAAGLALLVTGTIVVRSLRLVPNSDSVAQQAIVQTWLRAGHDVAYLPPDTWVLKLPVYVLFEALPVPPAVRLVLEAVTLVGGGYALLALALRSLIRRSRPLGVLARRTDVALPIAWLATVAGEFGTFQAVMPNYRNVELGLCFVLLAGCAAFLAGPRPGGARPSGTRPGAGTVVGAVVGVGTASALWVDDPYFAYLVGVPLLGGCLLWTAVTGWATGRDGHGAWRRPLLLAALVGASLALVPGVRTVLRLAGVRVVQDATAPTFDPHVLVAHLSVLWPGLSMHLGVPRSFGPQVWRASAPLAVAGVATLAVLAAGAVASAFVAVRAWRARTPVLALVAVLWVVVVAGVVANVTVSDQAAGRYLVLGVVDLLVVLGLATAALRRRRPRLARALTSLLAAAVLANVTALAATRAWAPPADRGRQDGTVAALRSTGAAKGFAEFWDANLYTQATGGDVVLSDVECVGGRLRLRHWLTDTAAVRMPSPGGTVVLWNAASDKAGGCTPVQIAAQLGRPDRLLPAPAGGVILAYRADVTARLDPAPRG